MKEWFYIIYSATDGQSREYEIRSTREEFLREQLDHYLKFSGISVKAQAYRISPRTGKPNFNTIVCETQIPF